MKIQKRHIRLLVWCAVVVFGYSIFVQWQNYFGSSQASSGQKSSTVPFTEEANQQRQNGNTIEVVSDVLRLVIDLQGGDIIETDLLNYKQTIDSSAPVRLISNDNDSFYVLRSGLAGKNGSDASQTRTLFTSEQQLYKLQDNQDTLSIDLEHVTASGIKITKTYFIRANDYLIDVSYSIDNQSTDSFSSRLFGQIVRTGFEPPSSGSGGIGVQSFLGGALTTPETAYMKVDFEDMQEKDINVDVKGGWIAMIQHYFVSSWIPATHETHTYQTRTTQGGKYVLGFVAPEFIVNPGDSYSTAASVYIGPKILDRLESIAPNLDLTIDFGWLWFIAIPLFIVLDFIHSLVSNWGLSIILLTVIVKLIFFYPSHLSYSSMARMRKLAPKMKDIKERYSSDKQKLQQEMMGLYKREKVNPLGGCLPILIQMPVFIALYWMLLESVELRHAPFMLWIHDLSALDPFFIMPIIMGATMLGQQLLSPAPPDPTQAKIMRLMPVVFTFLFLWFPSGLVLYWITNNSLSILQQWIITRRIEAQ